MWWVMNTSEHYNVKFKWISFISEKVVCVHMHVDDHTHGSVHWAWMLLHSHKCHSAFAEATSHYSSAKDVDSECAALSESCLHHQWGYQTHQWILSDSELVCAQWLSMSALQLLQYQCWQHQTALQVHTQERSSQRIEVREEEKSQWSSHKHQWRKFTTALLCCQATDPLNWEEADSILWGASLWSDHNHHAQPWCLQQQWRWRWKRCC